MNTLGRAGLAILSLVLAASASTKDRVREELRIKRKAVFEFTEEPTVTGAGDSWTIRFAVKDFCDVTIAIEDAQGKIVRHLASGVLGDNPPPPFQKESLRQEIAWDGKDDKGAYVDHKETCAVRASLGLRARFERHFLWSPYRRFQRLPPSFCAQPEGVYVFDGKMAGYIYQFDQKGDYVRTVYPFPAPNLDKLVGVRTRVFEQSGKELPWKSGYLYDSLLTCGLNTRHFTSEGQIHDGSVNSAMGIRNGQIALAYFSLNTLATDGTTGGRPLEGPETHMGKKRHWLFPRSVALSPDGNTAYVTGFSSIRGTGAAVSTFWVHGVGRVDVKNGRKGDKMQTFVGVLGEGHKSGGSEPGRFKVCSSVDCDPKGRVYVNDHFNDRVQVFDPAGKHLKSIPVSKPAEVCVDPRNGHLWVFSWALDSRYFRKGGSDGYGRGSKVQPILRHFGPFDDPNLLGEYSFPIMDTTLGGGRHGGTQYRAIVNFWAPGDAGPEAWIISGVGGRYRGASHRDGALQIMRKKKGKNELEVIRDFTKQATKDLPTLTSYTSQRLSVNPTTGELWIPRARLVIDPETGRTRKVHFPQDFAEMTFDTDGHAYFSTGVLVSRFALSASDQWRQVPFDYGEERGNLLGVLPTQGGPYHSGGISVSPKGHVLVAVMLGSVKLRTREQEEARLAALGGKKPWRPQIYKGRGGHLMVRVWDRYGKIVYLDAVQGIGYCHNVFMDKDDMLYVATGAYRTGYTDENTGTLVKMPPEGRILTTSSTLPLGELTPKRPPDTGLGGIGGKAWWEDAKWFYGGIGFNGKNHGGIHACHCSQFRISQDYFARTFVPETVHYTVGVVDSAGNLIMRIGQYGNVDDGVPLVPEPKIPKPRSLGGDEVAFFHPAYLAVHTDRRLFVNDFGNDRIVSVKLGYHAQERVPLKAE